MSQINYPAASERGIKRKNANLNPLTLSLSRNGERELAESTPRAGGVLESRIKA